jgi:cation:H+ antiporter
VFIACVFLLWFFCNKLSDIVDFIDQEFKLGNAFGGTIILSVVTNLPEIAITINGAINGNTDLAIGNILGGIVIQTFLLVIFDFSARKQKKPLSTLTSSKTSLLQGLFLIVILATVVIGRQMKESLIFASTTPPELGILVVWILSILVIKKLQDPDQAKEPQEQPKQNKLTRTKALVWLFAISIIVLVFGVLLESTSNSIASHLGINGILFGATILAFVTSLPELSGGLAFVKNKNYTPIISDIFGGNAFLPVLFLPATIITGKAVLPEAGKIDIYLTVVAIIMTSIYLMGMVITLPHKIKGLGIDSWAVLMIYIISVIGLLYI